MENLIVTRTACNSFTFTYSDTQTDLQVDIFEVSLDNNWDGDFTGLPLYTSFTIPHIELPSIVPIVTSLSLPSDKIYVFKYTKTPIFNDWYVPSYLELVEVFKLINLIGPHQINAYLSSTEIYIDGEPIPSRIKGIEFGAYRVLYKHQSEQYVKPIRDFILIETTPSYALGDLSVSKGYIFKIEIYEGYIKYYEFLDYREGEFIVTIPGYINSDENISNPHYNVIAENIGSGKTNTEILLQYASEESLINQIDLFIIEPTPIVEYSMYTIFCDLIQCRLNIIKRVLGELDNCKEECDCINVYDFNAFNAIYESILNLYEDLFSILNINVTNSVISASELDKLTTLDILLQQYKKYCIECKTPCKNC